MSAKRLDSIADYTRHRYRLRVDCKRCNRVVVIDPPEITMLCHRRGWSKQMNSVAARLRCAKCGSRDVRHGPGFVD